MTDDREYSYAVELGEHQLTAIRKMKNGCILTGGVGTGKSRTSLAYYYLAIMQGSLVINGHGVTTPPKKPMDLLIVTTAKKKHSLEWEKEALKFGLSTDESLSMGNVRVTIISWNMLPKFKDVKNVFVIFDEQRLVGSGAWVKAFIEIAKHNPWIILSATPGDVWLDYVPAFVANGFYRNRTEFLRRHAIFTHYGSFPKLERYVDTHILEELRARILVDMPYSRHTIRHVNNILVSYDRDSFERVTKDRWHIYEDRPIQEVSELFSVMKKVVNSDPSRIGAVMQLLEKHSKLIIFYNFNYELDMLRVLMNTLGINYGEWNGQKHEALPSGDRWIYLVQYTAGAEGWNCVETDAIVFWSLNYSWRLMEQAKGRIDRMDTKYVDLHYYLLRSTSKIDQAIMRALTEKREFNEKEYITQKQFDLVA